MRGRGQSASVPRDGVSNNMSIAELKKVTPCHGCGEYRHWYRECPNVAKQANTGNDFSNAEVTQGDLIQFGQNGNVGHAAPQNQAVPQLPVAPQSQRRQTVNAPRMHRNQVQALQNMFMDVVTQFPMFVEPGNTNHHDPL